MQRGFPLPFLSGILSYQVSGWVIGRRVFATLNAEAMLFVFVAGTLTLLGWLCWKHDASSDENPYSGRTLWWCGVIVGGLLGLVIRLKSG